MRTLEHVGGSTSKAAKILGISPRKIQYRLNEYRVAPQTGMPPVPPEPHAHRGALSRAQNIEPRRVTTVHRAHWLSLRTCRISPAPPRPRAWGARPVTSRQRVTLAPSEGAMKEIEIRIGRGTAATRFAAVLVKSGSTATRSFERARSGPGVQIHLTGERDYHVALVAEPSAADKALLRSSVGHKILLDFPGRRAVRQRLACLSGQGLQDRPEPQAAALDLTAGIHGAAPLFLLPSGELAGDAAGPAPKDMSALPVFVAAARWISARRTSSFECLFPPSAFFPDEPLRTERLTPAQAGRCCSRSRRC
ncbi:helix-turn-helix domain-containing protein [Nannocystis pusilla]|uniref:helix-turn-helix domain-containing protein n=1 Tax=Nannocystis pusilla TaxID=889268 RepID=UPI003B7E508B